jgi:oxalyl-CoA decarboxylase
MILISGSSEREIVDLMQGDYEEMDQLAVAKPVCKAAYRVLHAEDIGIGIARAIRSAVSGRPGGVYLDLPAKLFAQSIDAEVGRRSLIKVVDPAPSQIPAPDAIKRAVELLKGAKKPLIVLGKGAAYAQCDAEIRTLIEKTGIPYLPMSMAKGLLPDTHEQCASAARSFVLPEADVVMLIGARLNWLLSHGKGKTWGGKSSKDWGNQKFIQVDISPIEADSNVKIDAPLVGDIASVVSALLKEIGGLQKPPAEWTGGINERKSKNIAKMAETLAKDPTPMNFHSALNVVRDIVKANPELMLVNEGANALDFTRSIVDMYKPRKRIDVGTWGIMGIGMGYCVAAAVTTKQQVLAIEGDSAFGFSGMEVETICRYNLPVCIVIMNNNGVYKGTDTDPTGRDPAPTVFVKNARYDKIIEAFGGVGVNATTPAELRKGIEEAFRTRKPTLINAVIDETAGTESGRITSLNPTAAKKPKA